MKWSPHSPCQDHKECKENSMRNMTANVDVERVKTTNRENATFVIELIQQQTIRASCQQLTRIFPILSLFSVWSARAPKMNTTEYWEMRNMGVKFNVGDQRTASVQAGYQIAGLVATIGVAIIGGIVTGNKTIIP